MNILCFSTDLTSAEWASWVQSIGTIVAVLAAAIIAVWQSKKQHESAFALHKEEQRYTRLEQAKTLLTLCQNCTKATKQIAEEMSNRESLHKIASKELYFDFGELQALQNATSNIPLHDLPSKLITHAMILGAAIRQFKQNFDMAITLNRKMGAEQFLKFLDTLGKINESLKLTCGDIEAAVNLIKEQNA